MAQNLNPAIELLVVQIEDLERKANAYKASVNILCEKDGLPPMFPDDGGGGRRPNGQDHPQPSGNARPAAIGPDTFHGKPQQTAVRELLAIRRAADPTRGPAKPDEILAALKAGGYVVQAKSDEIALVGLRAMLRKRNTVFYKLPNGTWGLKEWYPNAKPAPKSANPGAAQNPSQPESAEPSSDVSEPETETAEAEKATAAA